MFFDAVSTDALVGGLSTVACLTGEQECASANTVQLRVANVDGSTGELIAEMVVSQRTVVAADVRLYPGVELTSCDGSTAEQTLVEVNPTELSEFCNDGCNQCEVEVFDATVLPFGEVAMQTNDPLAACQSSNACATKSHECAAIDSDSDGLDDLEDR